ncbi:MAG: hypothetical protein K0S56_984 [Microvirga sp.]|nr:hypothetical protein [Microvirga sp.]
MRRLLVEVECADREVPLWAKLRRGGFKLNVGLPPKPLLVRTGTDQALSGFSSPRTVGISSETVGWTGTAHCSVG